MKTPIRALRPAHARFTTFATVAVFAALVFISTFSATGLLAAPGNATPGATGAASSGPMATNLVVVLDLSDRIDPRRHPGQAELDRKLLEGLVGVFEEKVRRGLYLLSRDRLSIAVAPQESGYQGEVLSLADRLRIDMNELNTSRGLRGKPAFDRARDAAVAGIRDLYRLAGSERGYVGADLWSFFRDRLPGHLAPEGSARNVLVVVTDGYINFDPDVERARPRQGGRASFMQVSSLRGVSGWRTQLARADQGLIAFGPVCRGAEVLVVGLRYNDLRDQPVIEGYWTKWLGELGASRVQLLPADDSSALTRAAVRRFVEPGIAGDRPR